MGEWGTVSESEVKNIVTALPCVHHPQDIVKEGDGGASWELISDNRSPVMEMAGKCPLVIGIAWHWSFDFFD